MMNKINKLFKTISLVFWFVWVSTKHWALDRVAFCAPHICMKLIIQASKVKRSIKSNLGKSENKRVEEFRVLALKFILFKEINKRKNCKMNSKASMGNVNDLSRITRWSFWHWFFEFVNPFITNSGKRKLWRWKSNRELRLELPNFLIGICGMFNCNSLKFVHLNVPSGAIWHGTLFNIFLSRHSSFFISHREKK